MGRVGKAAQGQQPVTGWRRVTTDSGQHDVAQPHTPNLVRPNKWLLSRKTNEHSD